MPVYLFTYHAYGSWLPDRPQGFVQRNQGIQPPNPALAGSYRSAMEYEPVKFSRRQKQRLIEKFLEVCTSEGYRGHGAACEFSHLHVLVSWREDLLRVRKIRGRLKNLLALSLSRQAGTTGRPWFSQGASSKRVFGQQHFEYLMNVYLPRHRGWQWFENRAWNKKSTACAEG